MKLLTTPARTASLTAAVLLAGSAAAHAATVPYVENFDDEALGVTTGPSESSPESGTFLQSTSGTAPSFTIETGASVGDRDYHVEMAMSGGGSSVGGASLQFADLATAGFRISTLISKDSTAGSFGSSTANAHGALVARSTTSDLTATTDYYRLLFNVHSGTGAAPANRAGVLRLIEVGGATPVDLDTSSETAINVPLDTDFKLVLEGTPNLDGSLTLVGKLFDAGGTELRSITTTDITPRAGSYFGYRSAFTNNANARTVTLDYDDFNVQLVPEPSSLLAFAGLASLMRRRRG